MISLKEEGEPGVGGGRTIDAAHLHPGVIMWNPDGARSSYIFKALSFFYLFIFLYIFQGQMNLFSLEFIHRWGMGRMQMRWSYA